MIFDEKKKKLYAESASMIADMGVRGKLNVEEMHFLLSLLDIVVVKDQPQLIQILQVGQYK